MLGAEQIGARSGVGVFGIYRHLVCIRAPALGAIGHFCQRGEPRSNQAHERDGSRNRHLVYCAYVSSQCMLPVERTAPGDNRGDQPVMTVLSME